MISHLSYMAWWAIYVLSVIVDVGHKAVDCLKREMIVNFVVCKCSYCHLESTSELLVLHY
jgi:hypothetical protein